MRKVQGTKKKRGVYKKKKCQGAKKRNKAECKNNKGPIEIDGQRSEEGAAGGKERRWRGEGMSALKAEQ